MVLGLDIGTTSVKALVLVDNDEVPAECEHTHDLLTPHPAWAEEEPSDWWRGASDILQRNLAEHP